MAFLCLVLGFSVTFVACGSSGVSDGGTGDGGGTEDVTIRFNATVGTAQAVCGNEYTLGSEGSTATLNDLRFYVSNVRLTNAEDEDVAVALDQESPWQSGDVALLDFEDCAGMGTEEMNATVLGTVPVGEYNGIKFDWAVPFDVNHTDPLTQPTPLDQIGMFWNWAGGRKFVRIDLSVAPDIGWNFHLGSTMCDSGGMTDPPSEECGRPNRPAIDLAPFDPVTDTVSLDLVPLFGDTDIGSSSEPASGCQSFPGDEDDCMALFPNLGLDYSTGACISGCSAQSVFSVE